MNKPKVIVFEFSRNASIDVSALQRFGDIVYLFNKPDKPRPTLLDTERMEEAIIKALKEREFNPDTDFVCTSGAVMAVVQLVAAVVSEHGAIRFLIWDALQGNYAERELGYVHT